jgi:hypothetical protein
VPYQESMKGNAIETKTNGERVMPQNNNCNSGRVSFQENRMCREGNAVCRKTNWICKEATLLRDKAGPLREKAKLLGRKQRRLTTEQACFETKHACLVKNELCFWLTGPASSRNNVALQQSRLALWKSSVAWS